MELKNPLSLQDLGTGAAQLHALQESDAREATVLRGTSKATWAVIPVHWGCHRHCWSLALDKPCILEPRRKPPLPAVSFQRPLMTKLRWFLLPEKKYTKGPLLIFSEQAVKGELKLH